MIDTLLIEQCNLEHMILHDRLRAEYIGADVVVRRCKYGEMRTGRIVDLILTYDVSFGIDIYRSDGSGFCEERQWVGPRGLAIDRTGS